jgi:hypothetical protein
MTHTHTHTRSKRRLAPQAAWLRRSLLSLCALCALTPLFFTSAKTAWWRSVPASSPAAFTKALATVPAPGDLIINEYAADNDANGNDFIELLVLTDNLDLRGLRLSDNELAGGVLNNGESVLVLGQEAFLNGVPKGTTIAIYTIATGITPDTTVNPAVNDWTMVLASGTGVTASADGLGGSVNTGLSNGGEALYLYLPGPNGDSSGTDNIYLDFVSFESDGGDAPAGLVDVNLPSLADNAFYTGNTAAGNDLAANWTRYDFPASAPNLPTPGEANPAQDLSGLRMNGGGNQPPTIAANPATTTTLLNAPANSPAFVSGVLADPTDPARTLGINFVVNDAETAVAALTVVAASNNAAVVPHANLVLTPGLNAGEFNLKITPAGVGYATLNVTVTDGDNASTSYIVNYAASAASQTPATTRFHTGASDASGAIAVDANWMFVANDEDQKLRLYDRANSGLPLTFFDFTALLGLTDLSGGAPREVDLEAALRLGNRIFWQGSHSNASDGANRPNRRRIYATDLAGSGANATLSYVDRYDFLRDDLLAWDDANGHGLGASALGLAASAAIGVIPEEVNGGGFNIEGLTIAPDGTTAYVSFRAPLQTPASRTQALIVPVLNFEALVVDGQPGSKPAGSATFGAPIWLNLGGRGIREIQKNASNQYLIIAGHPSTATGVAPRDFRLYTWNGDPAFAPLLRTADLTGLNPEAIAEVPAALTSASVMQLLSDSGDTIWYNDGVLSKDLPSGEQQKFRSDLITLGDKVCPTITLAPATVAAGVAGTAYSQQFSASGLTGLATFAVSAGSLPNGLTLTSAGLLAGVPSQTGTFNFTVTATDANGCAGLLAYTLVINCPAITVNPATLAAAFKDAPYSQAFTQSGGSGAITFSLTGTLPTGLALNAAGLLSGTPTQAGNFSFTVKATDANGCTGERGYTLTVNTLGGAVADPLVCTGPGSGVSVTATVTNNGNSAQAAVFTATPQPALRVLANTCTATVGVCTIDLANNLVNWAGTLAAGQTVTLSYLAQLADTVAAGAPVCVTSTATVGNSAPGFVTACATVNCPPVGPGAVAQTTSPMSDQKPGSVLLYNIYTSSTDLNRQNTRLSLTNTHPVRPAFVHLFFVDGSSCAVADSYLCLTPNQTASFLASDIDPGTTGYVVAVAVDGRGCPINFNYLIGDEFVKFASGHAANLGAEAITAIAGGVPLCDGASTTADLRFDGLIYNVVPHVLAVDNVASRADGNDTLLILNRIGGNLSTGAAALSSLFGVFYDDAEQPVSFGFSPGTCQFRSSITNSFPRIVPRFEQFIPAGRSGWFKLWPGSLAGMTGAVINYNSNAAASANAFNQGHNLHKLTTTNTMVYTIPVFPPSC